MFEIIKSKDQLTIKGYNQITFIGVGALFLAAQGVRFLFEILPFGDDYTSGDIIGLLFLCFWIILVLSLGTWALATGSKQIVIDSGGILCKTWFRKRYIKWTDVKDFGLSYCGQTRGEGNTYFLYFSEHECPIKNECRKKLKGKMIKVYVVGNHYHEVVSKVMPFCEEITETEPFIGKDRYHFI